jgi:hypothetical protein
MGHDNHIHFFRPDCKVQNFYFDRVVVPTDGSAVTYYNGSQHYLKVTVIAKALSPIPTLKIIAAADDGWINLNDSRPSDPPRLPSEEELEREYQHQ